MMMRRASSSSVRRRVWGSQRGPTARPLRRCPPRRRRPPSCAACCPPAARPGGRSTRPWSPSATARPRTLRPPPPVALPVAMGLAAGGRPPAEGGGAEGQGGVDARASPPLCVGGGAARFGRRGPKPHPRSHACANSYASPHCIASAEISVIVRDGVMGTSQCPGGGATASILPVQAPRGGQRGDHGRAPCP